MLAHVVDERIDSELRVPVLAILSAYAQVVQCVMISLPSHFGERETQGRNELAFRQPAQPVQGRFGRRHVAGPEARVQRVRFG